MPPKPPPRPRLTHFLCIPLITPLSQPQLQSSLQTFKTDVTRPPTNEHPDRVPIPSDAIRPLGTLHLTLGVMSLENDERIRGAISILQHLFSAPPPPPPSSNSKSPSNKEQKTTTTTTTTTIPLSHPSTPLQITLHSLHPMHQPNSTSILYTSPLDPSHHLQTFCQSLKETFTNTGFMLPEERGRPLLLHATIVNTIYATGVRQGQSVVGGRGGSSLILGSSSPSRSHESSEHIRGGQRGTGQRGRGRGASRGSRGGNSTGHGKHKARLTIDARDILSKYANFTWMRDVRVEKVAICRMGARKNGNGDEEYVVEAEVNVPWR